VTASFFGYDALTGLPSYTTLLDATARLSAPRMDQRQAAARVATRVVPVHSTGTLALARCALGSRADRA
jgi:hypothetical protein